MHLDFRNLIKDLLDIDLIMAEIWMSQIDALHIGHQLNRSYYLYTQ